MVVLVVVIFVMVVYIVVVFCGCLYHCNFYHFVVVFIASLIDKKAPSEPFKIHGMAQAE